MKEHGGKREVQMEVITVEGGLPTAMRLGLDDSAAAAHLMRLTKGQRGGVGILGPPIPRPCPSQACTRRRIPGNPPPPHRAT
eukprot:214754-Prymnesium_polylepis.2